MGLPFEGNKEIILKNKPGTIAGIKEAVEQVLVSEKLFGFKDALSFRGRFSIAEGQASGRVLAPAARVLSQWASRSRPSPPTEELRLALAHGSLHLQTAGPRVVSSSRTDSPALVFTDGACEEAGTTVGGVLIIGQKVECFGFAVCAEQVDSCKTKLNQKQLIRQAELYPVLVAKHIWANELKGKRIIHFMDNEAARLGLVKAYSPVLPSKSIIMDSLAWDYAHGCDSWFARVPSL